jgi:exodeoxyribonuclease VII small subunit
VSQIPSQPDAALSFEDALARLEEIIERIESGEVGLEKAIGEYERGVVLIRRCKDILQKAEQRVDELTRPAPAGAASPPATPPKGGE